MSRGADDTKKETKANPVRPPLIQAFIASLLTCLRKRRSMKSIRASVVFDTIRGKAICIVGLMPAGPNSALRT